MSRMNKPERRYLTISGEAASVPIVKFRQKGWLVPLFVLVSGRRFIVNGNTITRALYAFNICGSRASCTPPCVYASEKSANGERCTFPRKEQEACRVLFRTMRRHSREIRKKTLLLEIWSFLERNDIRDEGNVDWILWGNLEIWRETRGFRMLETLNLKVLNFEDLKISSGGWFEVSKI